MIFEQGGRPLGGLDLKLRIARTPSSFSLSLHDRLVPSRRLARMGSYYPSHSGLQSLSSHPEVLFSQPAVHDVGGHLPEDGPSVEDDTAVATRSCSVRGCSTALPYDYPHKMCELCRSRHRMYASTKRAKRKQEKAMLGAQT